MKGDVLETTEVDLLIDTQDAGGVVVETGLHELLVDGSPDVLLVEEEQHVLLLEAATQGPPGPAGRDFILLTAAEPLGGHRCVRALAGLAVYADQADPADVIAVLGITRGAVDALAKVEIQTGGLMTEPSWSWTPDLPVFVGVAGTLTQVPPVAGFSLIVGVAITPTQIHIGAKSPIVLE